MPESPQEGQGPSAAMAMVLLPAPVELNSDAFAGAWRDSWPGAAPLTEVAGVGPALTAQAGGWEIALGMMPGTIPGGELDGPAATAWLWPDAPQAISTVRAHVLAFASGDGSAVDAHRVLTRVLVAASRATGALGVYCGAAGHVVQSGIFDDMAHARDPDLPVLLWVDLRAYLEAGRSSLFTVGLPEFGLPEIEISGSERTPGDLRRFVTNIAGYLIDKGPVIKDGDTVGGDEQQRILARHGPSMIDRPGPVLRLEGF